MSESLVYALHGFLGQATDWNFLAEHLKTNQFIAEDYFSKNCDENFIQQRISQFSNLNQKKFFIGYSLGGRIGLNILNLKPDLFDHLIFVSTNPGLPNDAFAERQERFISDQKWADKITPQNWQNFLKDWNSQSVFQNSKFEPRRIFDHYDVAKVKSYLLSWSQAKQPDYTQLIKSHNTKITWVVGESDLKYLRIAQDLQSKSALSQFIKISGGHRLWLDNPNEIVKIVQSVIH